MSREWRCGPFRISITHYETAKLGDDGVVEAAARSYDLLIRRNDARRQDGFEMFGAVAVDVGEIFVGDAAQLPAQFVGGADVSSLVRSRTMA